MKLKKIFYLLSVNLKKNIELNVNIKIIAIETILLYNLQIFAFSLQFNIER